MVGVTYRSSSARPGARGATAPPPLAPQANIQRAPPPTFRDKQSYTELFKPLPKPEPIPCLGGIIKMEAKSWRQLQEEREALMTREIQKTRAEAVNLWDRAKQEDCKRQEGIKSEQQRIEVRRDQMKAERALYEVRLMRERAHFEEEQAVREDIMRQSNAENLEKDRSRKLTLQRQESLLSGRMPRAKTEGREQDPSGRGAGIQVYHYKDPEVETIVRNCNKEEIRRRMSHGELLRDFGGEAGTAGGRQEEEKATFFNAQVMLRSQSGSSTTSR